MAEKKENKFLAGTRLEPRSFHAAVQCLDHYTTAAPLNSCEFAEGVPVIFVVYVLHLANADHLQKKLTWEKIKFSDVGFIYITLASLRRHTWEYILFCRNKY